MSISPKRYDSSGAADPKTTLTGMSHQLSFIYPLIISSELVTNHFLHFLTLERSDPRKFQVLQIISSILNWTDGSALPTPAPLYIYSNRLQNNANKPDSPALAPRIRISARRSRHGTAHQARRLLASLVSQSEGETILWAAHLRSSWSASRTMVPTCHSRRGRASTQGQQVSRSRGGE
jgi:GRAB domain